MATTKITGTGLGLPTADGAALGGASNEWSDLYLADGSVIYFGADQEVKITHVADTGLTLKHTATADDKPIVLTLQTGETDMAADDVIGKIAFQAPDEGTGTDAILVSAAIQARAEGDHSSSSNASSIDFMTGASEAAATKWSITSAGSFLNAGTNTIDMNGGELILDPDADTSITASTDDQIDIRIAGADDFTFTANTFTALAGSTITTPDLSVVVTDQSTAVLIESSDNSDANHAVGIDLYRSPTGATNDELMSINFTGKDDAGNKHSYFQFVPRIADASSGAEEGWIDFRGTRGGSDGQMMVRLQNNSAGAQTQLMMGTDGTAALPALTSADDPDTGIFFPHTAVMSFGHGGYEAHAFSTNYHQMHATGVAHGLTGLAETQIHTSIQPVDAAYGGTLIYGFAESNYGVGVRISGFAEGTSTVRSTSSMGPINLRASKTSGTTGAALSSTANALVVTSSGNAAWLVADGGNTYYDGSDGAGTWDEYDDVALLTAHRSVMQTDRKWAENTFGSFISDHAQILHDTGVITLNDDGHHFVSTKGLNGLVIDAIRQTRNIQKAFYNVLSDEQKESFANELDHMNLPVLPAFQTS